MNINIIYIYLNAYLCFCFSVFFFSFFCFNGYSFSCLSKVVLCFTLDEIVVFLMIICLLILYDRLSLCFVVCFSYWLLGFYIFIHFIKYVYAFLFGFIAFLAFGFSLLLFANASFILFKCSFLILYVCPFLRSLFSFVLFFVCLCYYLNIQIVNYKDI